MMIDLKALNLEKNQEIDVYTAKNRFRAKFKKISLNGTRLDVVDVSDEHGKPYSSFKYFSQLEVTRVVTNKPGEVSENPPATNFLTPQQLAVINESIEKFIFIQQPDAKYFEALEHISKQFVIGVSVDCCRGRIDTTSLLAITTGDKIYIFDLPKLNTEKTIGELKAFLESDTQLKIVFDARNIVDNFKVKLEVELQPVFDVMLAAAQFYNKESVISVENVVKVVLGVEVQADNATVHHSQEFLRSFAFKSAYLLAMYHKLSAKAFKYAFLKVSDSSSISNKDFFDGLELTPEKRIEKELKSKELKGFDFSVYEL